MNDLSHKLVESVEVVREKWSERPSVGIILGSGFAGLCDAIQVEAEFSGGEIPHYPKTTALGHKGGLLCGTLDGVSVIIVDGRAHLYEAHSPRDVVYALRVMIQLGVNSVVMSNASGAVNPEYRAGDVVILKDHINLMWASPLIGENDDSIGPRFPDMSNPYDVDLANAGHSAAQAAGLKIHSGVYLGMFGPNYETSAEYRMARTLGADVVGMSTVPEVLAARHAGIRVFAASVVSNVHSPENGPVSGQDVVDVVARSRPAMRTVLSGVMNLIRSESQIDEPTAGVSDPALSRSGLDG
jgi:purine-nucleoside phosphorylase